MIPLFKVYNNPNLKEINRILNSGQLSYNQQGQSFEKKISEFINNKLFLSTNNFSTSLIIGLLSLGLKKGDKIILSPVSCLASVAPLALFGFIIKWVDVDPNTGTICPDSLNRILKQDQNIKAVIHNNHCGYTGHLLSVKKIAEKYNLKFIIDSIESFGTQIGDEYIGSPNLADLTLFSFETVRILNSIEGGGLSFRKANDYYNAIQLRDYGVDRSKFRLLNGEINTENVLSNYGLGGKLNELNSNLGLSNLATLEKNLKAHRSNGVYWSKNLASNFPEFQIKNIQVESNTSPNYWVFGSLVNNKERFIQIMRDSNLTASGVHIPINTYKLYKDNSSTPGAVEFNKKFVAIPSGWWFNAENTFKEE